MRARDDYRSPAQTGTIKTMDQAKYEARLIRRMKSQMQPEGECLIWRGRIHSTGHPYAYGFGAQRPVRHIAYWIKTGQLPADDRHYAIYASCGRNDCVSPRHAELKPKQSNPFATMDSPAA